MRVICCKDFDNFDGSKTFTKGEIYEVYSSAFDNSLQRGYYEVIDNNGRPNLLYENEVEKV